MGDSLAGSAVQPVECDLYVMGSLQDEIWPAESSMKCALKLVELHRVLMVCYWSWVLASTLAYRSFECTWEVLKQRVAAHVCLLVCLDVDAMTRTWHPCMTPVCSMIGTAIIVSHRMMTCLRPGRATAKVWWSQSTSKDGNLFEDVLRARCKQYVESKHSRKPQAAASLLNKLNSLFDAVGPCLCSYRRCQVQVRCHSSHQELSTMSCALSRCWRKSARTWQRSS